MEMNQISSDHYRSCSNNRALNFSFHRIKSNKLSGGHYEQDSLFHTTFLKIRGHNPYLELFNELNPVK